MKLTIEVTQEDIDHGEPNNCYECPVATATKRAFEKAGLQPHTVDVSCQEITVFCGDGCHWHANTDDKIDNFIDGFDVDSEETEEEIEEQEQLKRDLCHPFSVELAFELEE